MSGAAWSAKVDISTKEAIDGLRAARSEAKLFGQQLNELDGIIRKNQGNLQLAVKEFTDLVGAQRAAAAAAKDMAQADIAAARAAGIRNTADAKTAELVARKGNQDAQAARATAQGALAEARVTDMTERRAAQQDRVSAANARQQRSQLSLNDSLSNTRYLMYDVGQTYTVLSAALLAIPAATEAVAIAYQRDFANVLRVNDELRVNGEQAAIMKDHLKEIAGDMPVAFGDLTKITQIGAQMGINNDKLAQFTETTAKFVAVTGISADTGSSLFGRMETSFTDDVQKFPDYFERLGASIAQVGADTVATDPEIVAMLNQIGPLGASAGFTSDQITGLAAALASVRVQPELARGTLTRVFGQINRYVAEGSPMLAEYGKVMGVSADSAAKMWKQDPSAFFQSLMKGLQDTQTKNGELTTTFDKLDIKASRDVSALTKLAVGYDTYAKSMSSAQKGFSDGTALNEMSKPIFETAVAKLQKLANAWSNLADTLGSSSLGPLAELIDLAVNLVQGLDGLIHDVPMVGALIAALMGFAAVTAVFLGFKAAQAFVIAGLVGFQQASSRGIGAAMSMSGVLKQSASVMLMNKGATEAQTRALLAQVGGWKALQIAMTTSSARAQSMNTVSNATATSTTRATGGIRAMGSSLLGLVGGPIGIAIMGLSLLGGAFLSAKVEAEQSGKAIAEAMQQGASSGARAVAEQLNGRKVGIGDGALGFSDIDKTATQIAERSGVAFEKMVHAITDGEKGMQSFREELDRVAKADGYKNLQDAINNPMPGTKAADLQFLNKVINEYAQQNTEAAKGLKKVEEAAPKAGAAVSDSSSDYEETASDIDKMTKALKDLNDKIFGTINSEADLQEALTKVGEGLQKSQSYSPNSAGGRDNLRNVEDALTKARDYYARLKETNQLTAQEAAQGYAEFSANLMDEIKNKFGGDVSYVSQLADQARVEFENAIGGKPVSVPVQVDQAQVQGQALKANLTLQDFIVAQGIPTIPVNAKTDEAQSSVVKLGYWLADITGYPYQVVMDALTDPANEKSKEVYDLLTSITNNTYTAPVDADTSAAIANVKNFASYARTELANLQYAMKGLGPGGVGIDTFGMADAKKKYASLMVPVATEAPKQVRATPMVDTNKLKAARQGLDSIGKGYDDAAKKAEKAGKKAKQAAEDMADGITDAVRQAEDYGNRLKTGLTSAFNQQYALTSATDAYHSALNAITKKREDEIKQVSDLRDKIRELNDERNKELITANKAKIEQNISIKYGEVDRAADYGQQAQEALNNAAAKQKDIDASKKQADEIQSGIGLLTGYSDAAIANRAALRDLESKTLDMIAAYAAQGHSMDQVRAYAQALTGQFQTDVGQMGFNQTAVQNLTGDLGRYIDVINRVPEVKPTRVEADTDAATQEMVDFGAAADEATKDRVATVDIDTSAATAKLRSLEAQIKGGTDGIGDDVSLTAFRPGSLRPNWAGGRVRGFASGGQVPGQSPANPHADNMMAKVDGKGLIGIRSREWIIPEPAVDYYGPSMMQAIQTMKLPKYFMGGSPSGATGSGGVGGAVELGAATLKTLTDAMRAEVSLQIDAREIARASNRGNKQLSAEGHN